MQIKFTDVGSYLPPQQLIVSDGIYFVFPDTFQRSHNFIFSRLNK